MSIDFSNHTDREILMNLEPRVRNLEDVTRAQNKRQDTFDESVAQIRRDLTDTEQRLTKRVDDRFDRVDKHLTSQDERLDKLVDKVADKKPKLSQGAVITITSLTTIIAFSVVAGVTHLFGW